MNIAEKEQELIDSFSIYDDWMEKYEYIIELGKDLPLIDAAFKKEENVIKGCQSTVWLHAEKKDDKIYFTADADAIIAKGIIALLIDVMSGETPQTILDSDLKFIKEIGLQEHLSPTRSNGLVAMVKQMKLYALALNLKK
ncbi:SufE family protein [Crocinitomix catalasitica]|uniref:SufE family protein n=1 Tax=Crocinitomix catalasitica TaxID=184607 RepID=UPI000485183D|nr:SufE family protein [Crocinitomix catalasitica]